VFVEKRREMEAFGKKMKATQIGNRKRKQSREEKRDRETESRVKEE